MALKNSASGYDSAFEEDVRLRNKQRERHALVNKSRPYRSGLASGARNDKERQVGSQISNLTAYQRHKVLVNHYYLYCPESIALLKRDTSKDKRDIDVIRENHRFLWDSDDVPDSWEIQLAKKYYDKLFKEYCICDLSRYKEKKVGMRWRIEKEIFIGKGQFSCGEKRCMEKEDLRSWEMNFAYVEHGIKKNALVKLRLCRDCSYKLNYYHQRKEVTRKSKLKHKLNRRKKERMNKEKKTSKDGGDNRENEAKSTMESESKEISESETSSGENIWKVPAAVPEEKSRDEEFEEYLEDLFM